MLFPQSPCIELYNATSNDILQLWKMKGKIKKEFEPYSKSYFHILLTGGVSILSLPSQDNGRTFKDIICFNQNQDKKSSEIDITKILFYPPKEEGDIIFYANEHCFTFLRYIFCIYERLNKLNEYSFQNEDQLININSNNNSTNNINSENNNKININNNIEKNENEKNENIEIKENKPQKINSRSSDSPES